jgi:predicted alpha/beta-hydrolase family hydrolase
VFLENLPKNQPVATLILAHGAGAAMDSAFMQAMDERLGQRDIRVLRFEFPYMAARRVDGVRRPPNAQKLLLDCWRQAYQLARSHYPGFLAIGGKSMGGRMASMLADELSTDALICLGYPFHAVGKPDKPRVTHLAGLHTPTLIVQGERDPMGNRHTVQDYPLSTAIRMRWLEAADHDFKPLKRSGLTHEQHLDSAADAVAVFLRDVADLHD